MPQIMQTRSTSVCWTAQPNVTGYSVEGSADVSVVQAVTTTGNKQVA